MQEVEDLSIDTLGAANFQTTLRRSARGFVSDSEKLAVFARSEHMSQYIALGKPFPMFELAGPREKVFFDPHKLTCGIVTCGGLCPGLNDVIRTIVLSLHWQYCAKRVIGYRYGFEGLSSNASQAPIELIPEIVEDIQNQGGTILGSSRGPQDSRDMVDVLAKHEVGILFAIGGDGTFGGANTIVQEVRRRNLPISVIGIPKTIDNDIYCSERTFGFSTAVQKAREAIYSAHQEAKAAWNGIGLVKLMGRDSGYIAVHSTLANSDVNFCLIPEQPFKLYGENQFLEKLEKRLTRKRHAVIVVAEGAGQDQIQGSGEGEKDPSGNVKYKDIGVFLKDKITRYFKEKQMPISLKYIDPSYTIRSCPANADDSAFCILLGQNAVHAGISGKTNMFVGYWNHHFVHVPMRLALHKRKKVDLEGPYWQSVADMTKQIDETCQWKGQS
ncbi:MAG: ATP-dependent 6-phosphofructokinase [Candidatus Omnitrophica bacterium]|nr:ATP-dependent 6-phosphofructokinase [Candidatus Omnitrophota bacterium]